MWSRFVQLLTLRYCFLYLQIQHFHHLINGTMHSPSQNMIVIPGMEWTDLPAVMEELQTDDAFAQKLAERSQRFWKHYLSKTSIDCYWRYLFARYAEIQTFKPVLHYNDTPYVSFK